MPVSLLLAPSAANPRKHPILLLVRLLLLVLVLVLLFLPVSPPVRAFWHAAPRGIHERNSRYTYSLRRRFEYARPRYISDTSSRVHVARVPRSRVYQWDLIRTRGRGGSWDGSGRRFSLDANAPETLILLALFSSLALSAPLRAATRSAGGDQNELAGSRNPRDPDRPPRSA